MNVCLTLMLTLSAVTAVYAEEPAPGACMGHLATVEPDGTVAAGSLAALRSAIGSGERVRVGWSLDFDGDARADLVHWADPGFLSLLDGHVFAQVATIQRQTPHPGSGQITLSDEDQTWTGLIGTDGSLQGRFAGGAPHSMRVRSWWCRDSRTGSSCPAPSWRLVYRHDADGAALAGSKAALHGAIRSGRPLRLAWGVEAGPAGGTVSVEHVAEPIFVSVARGDEVIAQLPEHVAQKSYWDAEESRFDQPSVMWRGLMSTDGSFDAIWVDRGTGETVRRTPQRAGVAWFSLSAGEGCDGPPLELAVPGGVRRDERE